MSTDLSRSVAATQQITYSVVVPVFNEAANVTELLEEIAQAMGSDAHEIIFVDDCSTDATLVTLRALAQRYSTLRVIRHGRNRGQSAALCSGAAAARGRWLITLDGDGQNDPADIVHLRAAMSTEPTPALVCGYRWQRRDSWLRRCSSRVANRVRAALLGDGTPDTGCSLKLLSRAAFLRLPQFEHMHRFLPALVQRDGGTVVSVNVSHRPRRHGQSKYGLWNRLGVGVVDLLGVMWLKRRCLNGTAFEDVMDDD